MKLHISKKLQPTKILFALIIIAFLIRTIALNAEYGKNGMTKWGDAKIYWNSGIQFASGNWFPDRYGGNGHNTQMIVGPLLPVLVAISIKLFGYSPVPILLLNVFLGTMLIPVLYYLGSMLINKIGGLILAIWATFNFSLIRYDSQILKEPIIILTMPLTILCLLKSEKKDNSFVYMIFSAVLFSTTIHSDERYLIYTPLYLLFFIIIIRPAKRSVKFSIFWICTLALSMVPWTIRNYVQFGDIVFITPRTTAFTSKIWGNNLAMLHFDSEEGHVKMLERHLSKAIEQEDKSGIVPHLYGNVEKYYKSFIHYWQPAFPNLVYIQYGYRPVKWSNMHNFAGIVFYGIFLPFYFLGLIQAFVRKQGIILFLAFIPLLHGILHTIMIWPLERYRVPTNSIIVLISIWFINELAYKIRSTPNSTQLIDTK